MGEGRAYRCSWKLDNGQYVIWVCSHPRVRVEGPTYGDAYDKLIYKWLEASNTDDGEPIFVFDRPSPERPLDHLYLKHDLMWFNGTGYTQAEDADREDLFASLPCTWCGYPTGARNDRPRVLTSPLEGHVSACSGKVHFGDYPILVSEQFLELLDPEERSCVDWVVCTGTPRSRKKIFEARPTSFVPHVTARHLDVNGWRCDTCRRRHFSIGDPRVSFLHAVRESDIPKPLPRLFAIGSTGRFQLVMAGHRVRDLMKHKHAHGMNAGRLGVIPDDVATEPELRLRENEAEERIRRLERIAEYQREHAANIAKITADLKAQEWTPEHLRRQEREANPDHGPP